VIGIDILTTFDILFEGAYAYLRRTNRESNHLEEIKLRTSFLM